MNDLFVWGRFVGAAGQSLDWKVECDALDWNDWFTIARMIAPRIPTVREIVPIPRGGDKFAEALNAVIIPAHELDIERATEGGYTIPRLIVDDVWTTGKSMNTVREDHDLGIVLFARGLVPDWCWPVWHLGSNWR